MRGVDNFPCDIRANKVIYMSCGELMGFPEESLKDMVVIFDEIDRCF
jgi:hypothetical protein